MSYQVLARKYRPRSFQTLVGQEHVVRALTHALEQQRLHHAYLFTGTRGVGKTTLSRILAKSLNCETGITAIPCGVCDACTAIDAGRFVDYIEMDAASNRGVDEMVQLLEQAVYAPSNARFKVYMIDEVHMLTNFAFNAMLKTLEEPPSHVKFILATTDPQKIPVTVLSRCLQFTLKQMPPLAIVDHLQDILGQEHIDFEVPALRLLAKGAQGSMRDALSLTDQAIAYAAGTVTLEAVQGMLGALDQRYLIAILDALVTADGAGLLAVADQMAARSLSYKVALQDLATLLHQISVAQLAPAALALDVAERDDILRLAQALDGEQIHLFYQIAVHGRNELGLAPDEYAGFGMTLLRMLAYRPVSAEFASAGSGGGSGSGASSRPAAARSAVGGGIQSAPAVPVSVPVSVPVPVAVPAAAPVSAQAAGARTNPAMAALARLEMARNERNGQRGTQRGAPGSAAAEVAGLADRAAVTAAPPVPSRNVPQRSQQPVQQPSQQRSQQPSQQPSQQSAQEFSQPPWEELDALDEARYMAATEAVAEKKTELKSPPAIAAVTAFDGAEDAFASPVVDHAAEYAADYAPDYAPDYAANHSAGHAVDAALGSGMDAAVMSSSGVSRGGVASTVASASAGKVPEAVSLAPVVAGVRLKDGADWDGDWPQLVTRLTLRGVAQQLALQSELIGCDVSEQVVVLTLRVPLETLLSAGSVDKLTAVLATHFAQPVRLTLEIGAVQHTAHAEAIVVRARRQEEAEAEIHQDPLVLALMQELGAVLVTGSVRAC